MASNQLVTECGKYRKRRCKKIRITDLDELKQRLSMEWAKLDHVVIAAFVSDGVVDNCRSVMRALYTFSCNISHTLLSAGFKSGEFEATVEVGKILEFLYLTTQL